MLAKKIEVLYAITKLSRFDKLPDLTIRVNPFDNFFLNMHTFIKPTIHVT